MDRLTATELEILAMICGGSSYAEIAQRRFRAVATVKNQALAIHKKLNVHTNAEACMLFCHVGGLVEPSVPPPEGDGMRASQI